MVYHRSRVVDHRSRPSVQQAKSLFPDPSKVSCARNSKDGIRGRLANFVFCQFDICFTTNTSTSDLFWCYEYRYPPSFGHTNCSLQLGIPSMGKVSASLLRQISCPLTVSQCMQASEPRFWPLYFLATWPYKTHKSGLEGEVKKVWMIQYAKRLEPEWLRNIQVVRVIHMIHMIHRGETGKPNR